MRAVLIVTLLVSIASTNAAMQPTQTSPDIVSQIDPKWALTQGGLLVTLLIVLWSYRRDFFRKDEDRIAQLQRERDEKADLKAVLREVAASNQAHAISVQRNTDAMDANTKATERLAASVTIVAAKRGDLS